MIGKNKFVSNIIFVLCANVLSILAGIVTAILIPHILGITDYAYFMLFMFYVGYVGLLHFGFIDGIYVAYRNYDYDQLPKYKIRLYFYFLLLSQIIIAITLILICLFFIKDNIKLYIYFFIFINAIILNIISFFNVLNQITRRFNINSVTTVISKLLWILFIVLLMVLNLNNSKYYIILFTLINLLVLSIYCFTSKDLLTGHREELSSNSNNNFSSIFQNFMILIGYFMISIVIGIGRFIVEKLFSSKDFAMYSFGVTLIGVFIVLIAGVTSVLFPYLARKNVKSLKIIYQRLKIIITLVIGISLPSYYVIKYIIILLLPDFINALDVTLMLFASLFFIAQLSMIIGNYYRCLEMKKEYGLNSIIAFSISIIVTYITYKLYKSIVGISFATLISMFLWMIYSDYIFYKKIGVKVVKVNIIQIFVSALFLLLNYLFEWYVGIPIYYIIFISLYYLIFKNDIILLKEQKLNYFKI